MNKHDAVYKPSHYEKDGCLSTQEIVRDMFKGTEGKLPASVYPWWKDAFKYIWRWPLKHPDMEGKVEDLKKAKRCIDMVIEELEANGQITDEEREEFIDEPDTIRNELDAEDDEWPACRDCENNNYCPEFLKMLHNLDKILEDHDGK